MRRILTLLISSSWMASHLATQAQSLQLLSTTTPSDAQAPVDAVAAPNRLYVADFGASSLRIYDTSQPTALVQLGSLSNIVRPNRVAVSGTKVYLASSAIGITSQSYLYAIDVSDAAVPSLIRRATLKSGSPHLVANETLVCSAISSGTVYVFDNNLNQLSTISTSYDGIALHNDYLYILAGTGLLTYDLSVPATPVLLGRVTVGAYMTTNGLTNLLAVNNNYLYINGHKGIFTLSNPALPALASTNSLTFNKTSGSTAYRIVTGFDDIITVVDLRVPTAPAVAASTTVDFTQRSYSSTDAVTGQGDLVYAINSNGGQVKTYRYTAAVLSTRESAPLPFALYPNPAADEVTLELPTAAVAGQRVALLNVCGQLVREQTLPAGSTRATIHLATLRAGVYFVQAGSIIQKLLRQ